MHRTFASFFLALLAALAVASGRTSTAATGDPRPNVLLILADDFGYECVGANGSASYRTPNLDRLARRGARFTHCYTPPLCTPTRVQLMTGRYSPRNYTQFGTLAQGEKTFAHVLKAAGYATAVAGKWQLDSAGGQTPIQAGFDEYCLWNVYHEGRYLRRERYAEAELSYLDRATGRPSLRKCADGYGPDACSDYLDEFITRCAREKKPFLAYYPMILTHGPFQPTPASPGWKTGSRLQRGEQYFNDMVEYADLLVGKLVRKLEKLRVRRNTLVLFLGDNGTAGRITSRMKRGRAVAGGKGRLTEAGTRTPFIASWPGAIDGGQVIDDPTDTSDFLPALAQAAGAALPQPPGDGVIDGRSFLPRLRGRSGPAREWALVDYRAGQAPGTGPNDGRFAHDRRWKLYGTGTEGRALFRSGSLYDLRSDPGEAHPVPPGTPEADAARRRLEQVLAAHPQHPGHGPRRGRRAPVPDDD